MGPLGRTATGVCAAPRPQEAPGPSQRRAPGLPAARGACSANRLCGQVQALPAQGGTSSGAVRENRRRASPPAASPPRGVASAGRAWGAGRACGGLPRGPRRSPSVLTFPPEFRKWPVHPWCPEAGGSRALRRCHQLTVDCRRGCPGAAAHLLSWGRVGLCACPGSLQSAGLPGRRARGALRRPASAEEPFRRRCRAGRGAASLGPRRGAPSLCRPCLPRPPVRGQPLSQDGRSRWLQEGVDLPARLQAAPLRQGVGLTAPHRGTLGDSSRPSRTEAGWAWRRRWCGAAW